MPAKLKLAGDGSCCDCGDVDGCECRKCSTLECRSRGGVVTLCGFDEFEGYESTPPKFYLETEIGGSIVICDYHSPYGKGPCEPDECESPIGAYAAAQVYGDTSCGPPALRVTGMQATVTGVAPTPGSPGFVRVTIFAQPNTNVIGQGTGILYLNSELAVASSTNENVTLTRDYVSGTIVTMTPGGDNVCISGATSAGTGPVAFEACIPQSTSTRYKYSGKATYIPASDCEAIALDTREVAVIGFDYGCSPPETGGTIIAQSTAFDPEFAAYVVESDLNSGSYRGQVSNGSCSADKRATACDRYEQLQSEDTDEDALARLLAGPGGVWSAWQVVDDGTNGTCLNPACCRAAWEIRTYRTFTYREAEWRATVEGLAPGTEVTIKITVYRKAFGPGPYAEFQTEEYLETADSEGKATAEGVVPNDEGFETYVGCTYTPPAP